MSGERRNKKEEGNKAREGSEGIEEGRKERHEGGREREREGERERREANLGGRWIKHLGLKNIGNLCLHGDLRTSTVCIIRDLLERRRSPHPKYI